MGPLVQGHGAELMKQSVDLLGWAVTALDGEKDPRCLLLGFQSIRELCSLYATHDPEVRPSNCPYFGDFKTAYFLRSGCQLHLV